MTLQLPDPHASLNEPKLSFEVTSNQTHTPTWQVINATNNFK